ncbi:MAG: hypothetical protein H6737_13975 [Alphaproteobacteria bacterium]|nr:hypothetical protein [Alphaproteobacteria bacterium]
MLVLVLAAVAAPEAPAWMAGCWEADGFSETWLGPVGGVLSGAALSRNRDGSASWEHLWVGPIDGQLAYVATPSGQERTVFPATEVTDARAVFENPEHDFPQRITYENRDDVRAVRVEARDGDEWRGFDLAFRACGTLGEPVTSGRPPEPAEPPCDAPDPEIASALATAAASDRAEPSDAARRLHRAIAHVAVAERRVCSADDALNAAQLLQHGPPADLRLAHDLFAHACASGVAEACPLQRETWDRVLVGQGRPQWYGTQWSVKPGTTEACAIAVDPEATDALRVAAGHAPLEAFVVATWAKHGVASPKPKQRTLAALAKAGWVCEP